MSDGEVGGRKGTRWEHLAPWLLIGGLLVFHTVNNWIWLAENVTATGWDEPRHLAYSLRYSQILESITVKSLFEVMASDPIRPPLFAASATIPYRLFGQSADTAKLVNVLYMAIALATTYGIGQRWGGHRLGLVSTALLAVFPMFYAMSRRFYVEFALMAFVALTVYLMVATDGFRRRGMSLLFGLSLGLGLLTKRTFPVFVIGPTIAILLAYGLVPMAWQRLKRRPRLYWKRALLALTGGLALAALWYLPNREAVKTAALGGALLFIWWALAALAIYFISLPSAPLSNTLAALFLGATLASTWYLAHLEFLQRLMLYGYGVNDPRGRALRLDSLDTYLDYLRYLGNEHLSFLLFIGLGVVLAVAVVVFLRQQGSVKQTLRQVKPEGWAIVAWVGGAYLLLTLSIYHETRAFTPVLPAVALLSGTALLKLPWRGLRWALLTLVLLFGLLQFFALSYESVNQLLPPRVVTLPVWGWTSSFALGTYIQLPDEGLTDRAYSIEPDVLQQMEERRVSLGKDLLSLGLLANTRHINTGRFNYLMLAEAPHLRVESLIDGYDGRSAYQRLFAHDYVLVKRSNFDLSPAQEQVIRTILDEPSPLFTAAFELEASYPLPDGDTAYLYRQRTPLPSDYPVEYLTDLAGRLSSQTRAGDAILLITTAGTGPFVSHYTGPAEIYPAPVTAEELANITARHPRLFLVLDQGQANDRSAWIQEWLSEHSFWAAHEWIGGLQLLTYGTNPSTPAATPAVEVHATLGDQIELVGYDLPADAWQRGDILPLSLFWRPLVNIPTDYRVFLHLLDGDNRLLAQTDAVPVGGSRPTTTWSPGEEIRDPVGLLVPADSVPGEYRLVVGMYRPDSGERLPVRDLEGTPGDSILLSTIQVGEP